MCETGASDLKGLSFTHVLVQDSHMVLILYILLGAALGALVSYALDMKTEAVPAIAIAALGGLVGGLAFYIVIPFWTALFGIIGALLGALALLWVVSLAAR